MIAGVSAQLIYLYYSHTHAAHLIYIYHGTGSRPRRRLLRWCPRRPSSLLKTIRARLHRRRDASGGRPIPFGCCGAGGRERPKSLGKSEHNVLQFFCTGLMMMKCMQNESLAGVVVVVAESIIRNAQPNRIYTKLITSTLYSTWCECTFMSSTRGPPEAISAIGANPLCVCRVCRASHRM